MRKKILMTGQDGFIGSALKPKLLAKGYEVHSPKINIKRYNKIKDWIQKNKPDYVIHLASTNSIMYSYTHYIDVLDTNFVATANIAEACRSLENFKQFICASSTEVYGNVLKNQKNKLHETSLTRPNNPHAISKCAMESYVEYLGRNYNFPYTILRPSNTYGRTKNPNFFVERIITQMLSNKTVRLGNPNSIRDFLFVKDHVNAYLKIIDNPMAIKQTINICTGIGHSTSHLARTITKLINFKGEIEWNALPKRPNEATMVIGDNSKARRILGWKPKYSLEKGLKETIKYWNTKVNKNVRRNRL